MSFSFNAYLGRLFTTGAIPRRHRTIRSRNSDADQYSLGGQSYNGRIKASPLLNNWPTTARIGLNWDLFANLYRHGLERGELRRVRIASESAGDIRQRFVNLCEGKHQVPRDIPCDRMFAENVNDVFFLAACAEYVAFASELPASDAKVAQISDVVRECHLASGRYDYTDHDDRTDNCGARQRLSLIHI